MIYFEFIRISLIYILLGLLWNKIIQDIVVGKIEGPAGEPFSLGDKIRQTLLWPVSLVIFIVEFIKQLIEQSNK
jgi:hypothetical protein